MGATLGCATPGDGRELEMEGGGWEGGYDDKGLVFGEEGRGKGNNELSTLDKD